MAVRFSASGQHYSAPLPVGGAQFTIAFLAKMTTDRNAVSGLFGIAGTTAVSMSTTSDGTTLRMIDEIGTTTGSFAMTVGTWYKLAFTNDGGTNSIFYHSALGSDFTSDVVNFGDVSGVTAFYIGCSRTTSEFFNGCITSVKVWSDVLTATELEREFDQYVIEQTSAMEGWYPWIEADTKDYAGWLDTLTGGTGATTEDGPPIPWRTKYHIPVYVPRDPTSQVWYAVYIVSTGALYSIGDDYELQADMAVKQYVGAYIDVSMYEWDTIALDFVPRAGFDLIDRIQDLVADPALSTVWASLTVPESDTLKARLATFLGPFRYREHTREMDL